MPEPALEWDAGGDDAGVLVIEVEEKGRFALEAKSDVAQDEGSVSGTYIMRNVLGGGERAQVNMSVGSKLSSSWDAELRKPFLGEWAYRMTGEADGGALVLGVFRNAANKWAHQSHHFRKRGMRVGVEIGAGRLEWEGAWRETAFLHPDASMSVRREAGHAVASKVSYTWSRDTRDSAGAATRGARFGMRYELAGYGPLGGDVRFGGAQCDVEGTTRLGERTFFTCGAAGGLLFGAPRLADRYRVEPPALRGYHACSLGPQDGRDSLGGLTFGTAMVMLSQGIGESPTAPLRANLFANAGAMGKAWAASAGVGISMDGGFGRIELNLCHPLAQSPGSAGSKAKPERFQLSFGVALS